MAKQWYDYETETGKNSGDVPSRDYFRLKFDYEIAMEVPFYIIERNEKKPYDAYYFRDLKSSPPVFGLGPVLIIGGKTHQNNGMCQDGIAFSCEENEKEKIIRIIQSI